MIPPKKATLVFLLDGDRVLLALKKRGFGEGLWNGVGGKVNDGEGIMEAAKREAAEEIGVTITKLTEAALLKFRFPDKEDFGGMDVYVFLVTSWEGTPIETEEMRPEWFALTDVPYDQMWDDDRLWLRRVLDGEKLDGEFTFDKDNKVLTHSLKERK